MSTLCRRPHRRSRDPEREQPQHVLAPELWLLGFVALGLTAFGAYSVGEARYRKI